jgi:hypothetical protein
MSLERPIASSNETFGNWRISESSICGNNGNGALRREAHLELCEREKRIIEERDAPVISQGLLLESLFYRFQGFLRSSGLKGKVRRALPYFLPAAFERAAVSLYNKINNHDLKANFFRPYV